jgi:hypothetical protein
MDAVTRFKQAVDRFKARLEKDFPQEGGAYAVVRSEPRHSSMHEGFEADPTADNRPQFVRDDEIGWVRVGVNKSDG